MHDAVPVAAVDGFNLLTDRVRLVEEIVQQPQTRQAAACCIAVDDPLAGEDLFDRERGELRPQRFMGAARPERADAIGGDQLIERRRIEHRQ
jgi:hypothetical protein